MRWTTGRASLSTSSFPPPAGGGSEILSRRIAYKLEAALGQPVVLAHDPLKSFASIICLGESSAVLVPLIDSMNRELMRAAQNPEVQGQAEKVGSNLTLGTPEAFAQQLRQDVRNAAALVKEAGAKIQ